MTYNPADIFPRLRIAIAADERSAARRADEMERSGDAGPEMHREVVRSFEEIRQRLADFEKTRPTQAQMLEWLVSYRSMGSPGKATEAEATRITLELIP